MIVVKKKFSDEQIERASKIDIVEMLKRQGEKLKREGSEYRWQRHESTTIRGNRWFRHSEQIGGGPIQFIQHFYNMDYVEAVRYLLNGEDGAEFVQTEEKPREKPVFIQPKLSENMHRSFAYLIKTRGIAPDVVQYFVNEKKIVETEEFHNVAFCGYDENGIMKQMHLRSTIPGSRFFLDVEGSDKQYYFRHIGTSENVYVFEAPIDMLSFITMNKEKWQQHNYVCLGGVAKDALLNILENNEHIKMVYFCVDQDEAGDKIVKRVGEELTEKGIEWDRILPKLKDWNEDLMAVDTQNECFSLSM